MLRRFLEAADRLGMRIATATRPATLTMIPLDPARAPDWDETERAEYRRRYLAGEPIALPFAEHHPGECDVCDALRELLTLADDEDDAAAGR